MRKSKYEGGFLEYLRGAGGVKYAVILLILGVALLMLFSGGGQTSEEAASEEERVAEMCSLTDGAGDCRVMITYGTDGRVYAVAVLCDGGDNPSVKARIVSMISSLYGIGTNRISVLKITEEKV